MKEKEDEILAQIRELELRIDILKHQLIDLKTEPQTVKVPDEISDLFLSAEKKVQNYFSRLFQDPRSGEITVEGERYVLLRSASLSVDFMEFILSRYNDKPASEAISIGNNFLYDNAKVIGKRDALAFHKKLHLKAPIDKLSAGPVHFAFTGWATVEIDASSNPVADENYFLKFIHHNSFEAQSWIKKGKKSDTPVCTMNCGYSAGWCEESFGISLTTVEIECEAQGADHCTFIMAPTDRIDEYVGQITEEDNSKHVEIPVFFKRKQIEEQLRNTISHKESLIQEIHHRVKNNLQIVISLLRLQKNELSDQHSIHEFESAINRVNMMATVHELLYQQLSSSRIGIKMYFETLMTALFQLYSNSEQIKFEQHILVDEQEEINIDESIPIALILNEIVCNSFKHALGDSGTLEISIEMIDRKLIIVISDNGPGLSSNNSIDGLGMTLIELLADQIDADISRNSSENGLVYKIEVNIP